MLEPQNDSGQVDRRALQKRPGELLVVHCAVLVALVGLAISNHASPTLISNAVQAEYVTADLKAAAPMQLVAQPAIEAAREN